MQKPHFFDWLYKVFDDAALPCSSKIKGSRTRERIDGCFHHLNTEEAFKLINVVQVKLTNWGAACISNNLSCGSVLLSSNDGKGQSSLMQQLIGLTFKKHVNTTHSIDTAHTCIH